MTTTAKLPRRTTLAVPASNPRMIEKARGLDVDAFFLDLEDACAPSEKANGRRNIVTALNEGGFGNKIRIVRVNSWDTEWTYRDVVDVVEGAGANLDCIMLPKVESADQVAALDLLLGQIERSSGLEYGRLGIEAQIESANGLRNIDAIAQASPRLQTLILGPADLMASLQMKTLTVGQQPPGYDVGDAYHHILMSILITARAHDIQAIDGPYLAIKDLDGLGVVAGRSAALGFDGKWVLHPSQVEVVNEIFRPRQADFNHAEHILQAYAWHTSIEGGSRGAAMLGDEMIDEASRKMALVISAKGRAAGMEPSSMWSPPISAI